MDYHYLSISFPFLFPPILIDVYLAHLASVPTSLVAALCLNLLSLPFYTLSSLFPSNSFLTTHDDSPAVCVPYFSSYYLTRRILQRPNCMGESDSLEELGALEESNALEDPLEEADDTYAPGALSIDGDNVDAVDAVDEPGALNVDGPSVRRLYPPDDVGVEFLDEAFLANGSGPGSNGVTAGRGPSRTIACAWAIRWSNPSTMSLWRAAARGLRFCIELEKLC